jgi:hypothetical protein
MIGVGGDRMDAQAQVDDGREGDSMEDQLLYGVTAGSWHPLSSTGFKMRGPFQYTSYNQNNPVFHVLDIH